MNSSFKFFLSIFALSAFCSGLVITDAQPVQAKTTKKSKKKRSSKKRTRKKSKLRLVPPPPAYAPSILPELAYSRKHAAKEEAVEEKPENPYAKYIYHRDQHKIPTPVKQNKYVTYWNKG